MPVFLTGDMVLVEQQQTADNGDMVVALIDDEIYNCKDFYKEEDLSDFNRRTTLWIR